MISKCSTVVLSKSKFSDFEVFPGPGIDNLFLVGYSYDEDGNAYNVKIDAESIVSGNKFPNIINVLDTDGNDNYKWKHIDSQHFVCEFNTVDFEPYVEVKEFEPAALAEDSKWIFGFKLSDETPVGTVVTVNLKNIPGELVHAVKLYFSDNSNAGEFIVEHVKEIPWQLVMEVVKTTEGARYLNARVIDADSEIDYDYSKYSNGYVVIPEGD